MLNLTRREFVRHTVLAVAAAKLSTELQAESAPVPNPAPPKTPLKPGVAAIHWLDGRAPAAMTGTTWGVPWPRGQHPTATTFVAAGWRAVVDGMGALLLERR